MRTITTYVCTLTRASVHANNNNLCMYINSSTCEQ